MKTIERPESVPGSEIVDAGIVLNRGILNEVFLVVGHPSMVNNDKIAVLHELTRPMWFVNPRAACEALRQLADAQPNTITPEFYARASDHFEDAANAGYARRK